MNRVKLKKLIIQDFRTLAGRHEIVFQDNGLVAIKGKNLETGGSSNSGKSNVLKALAFLFKICPHPATECQNWHTESPMLVEGVFDTNEGEVVLRRGSELSITVAGKKVSGAAKAVEAKLDEITGVSAPIREALTYRDQRWPKSILAMKDTELKKFLTQVLGLEALEADVAAAGKRVQAAMDQVELKNGAMDIQTKHLDALECSAPPPAQDVPEALEDAVLAARDALDDAKEALAQAQQAVNVSTQAHNDGCARINTKYEKLESGLKDQLIVARSAGHHVKPNKALVAEVEELEDAVRECQDHLARLRQQDNEAAAAVAYRVASTKNTIKGLQKEWATIGDLEAELVSIGLELEQLEAQRCPTCSQQWVENEAKVKETKERQRKAWVRRDRVAALGPTIEELEEELAGLVHISNPKLAQFEAVAKTIDGRLRDASNKAAAEAQKVSSEARALMASIQEKLDSLEDRKKLELAELTELGPAKALIEAERAVHNATAKKVAATTALKEASVARDFAALRVLEHDRLLVRQASAVAAALEMVVLAKAELAKELDYTDLIKGFRNKVFDEVLESIGTEASNILAELPNAQDIAIDFRSERETGTGTIEQRIKPVITVHGVERGLDASSSGGQYTSVALAVDLAVIKVVSSRMGCDLQWLVLDETFGGHDVVTKAACLELLQVFARDKLVLVVDHATEVKEMFSQEIVVEYNNKKSRILPRGS